MTRSVIPHLPAGRHGSMRDPENRSRVKPGMTVFMKYFVAAGLLILLFLGYFHPITALTQDLGRHLKTGELIVTAGSVPKTNLYSYTFPDFPFINHHWGSEVIFFLLHQVTGFPGLFVLMLLLVVGAFSLQLFAGSKHASPLALAIAGLLYIGIVFERTDLRPELFSFFLLSVFVFLLYRNREKPATLLFLLVPLQLFWVNLHIYFAVGLIVIGLFLVDRMITHRKNLMVPPVKQLGVVFLLSCIVSLLNPNGIDGLLYPLRVFQNYGYTIEENQTVFLLQSLGFTKPSFPYFLTAVSLLLTSLAVNYRKTRPIDWLLSLTFTYLAFSAVRNFPLFVFTTFIPFTFFFTLLLRKLSPYIPDVKSLKPYGFTLTVALIVMLFLWQGRIILTDKSLGYGVSPGAEKAVDFFLSEQLPGPIFNNFDIGSYLIYRLYPQERVFVDGRPEAYPAAFLQNTYIPMQTTPALFDRVASEAGINSIFYAHTDQTPWGNIFLSRIASDPGWVIVYVDDYVITLVKNTAENASLITQLGMNREQLRIVKNEETFEANLRLASFFTKVGWHNEGLPYYLALLTEKPDFCPALGLVAQTYQQQNNPSAIIYGQKYTESCL